MTDREMLIEMLKKANIDFDDIKGAIVVERGYIGFVSIFTFNEDGSLKDVGAYE